MHLKRIIAALVLTPLFLLLIIKGSYVHYSMLVVVLASLGLWEYFNLIGDRVDWTMRYIGILWGVLLTGGLYVGSSQVIIAMLTFGFISVCLIRLSKAGDLGTVFQEIGYTFLGPLYVGLLLGHLTLLRATVEGREWTLLLFFTIWMGDIAAFYTGLSIGKHKLYPEISPNKTIEGAIGGIIGCFIIVTAAKLFYMNQLSVVDVAILSIGIAVMGQLGDLCESMFKRAAGVKDSGNIIPGHGGILDRFDSVLFAAPFLYYYLVFIKGIN
ncbi:MAG: cdsA [Deltaproteobacteria bacterium]|nr:cdsA [Deltaproteobacteria bacterium]